MSDIVERLRGRARGYRLGGPKQMAVMLDEGADEIERLRAALRYIAWEQKEGDEPHLIARAALEGK